MILDAAVSSGKWRAPGYVNKPQLFRFNGRWVCTAHVTAPFDLRMRADAHSIRLDRGARGALS